MRIFCRFENLCTFFRSLILLQCAIPCFEDLLPNTTHNTILMNLLYSASVWDAYAKMNVHTDTSLHHFDVATRQLGDAFRVFQRRLCPSYNTIETPKEAQKRAKKGSTKVPPLQKSRRGPVKAVFNLAFYKFHKLGDVPDMIRMNGTTGSYSTKSVSPSLAHL